MRLPLFTVALVALGVAASLYPGMAPRLEYDRAAVGEGAVHRSVTGQLVHWTHRMTILDLGAVLVLCAFVESRARPLAIWTVLASAVAVALALHLLGETARYRGASGIASGLFVVAALVVWHRADRRAIRIAGALALALFVAKLLWETMAGEALAAGPMPEGVTVLPLVHVAGALAGTATWLVLGWRADPQGS